MPLRLERKSRATQGEAAGGSAQQRRKLDCVLAHVGVEGDDEPRLPRLLPRVGVLERDADVVAHGHDLALVQDLFLSNRDEPPVAHNLPPVSGAIAWCRALVERIHTPMLKLQKMNKRAILDLDESKEVFKRYHGLRSSLEEYVMQKVGEWGRDVEASSQANAAVAVGAGEEAR